MNLNAGSPILLHEFITFSYDKISYCICNLVAAEGLVGHFYIYIYIYTHTHTHISFSHLDRVKMFQHLAFQTLPTTPLKLTGKLCMQTFSALLRRMLLAIRLFTVFAHVTAPRCSTTYRHGPTYRGVFLLQGTITTHIEVLCLNRP